VIPVHIAFFNRSYAPDETATAQLLADLAEGLVAEHGCRVSVVAGLPAAAETRAAQKTVREARNGVTVIRVRGTRFSKHRFVGRAANYLTYFLSACRAGLALDRPDIVVALTDPPIIGLAARLAGWRARAPLVMVFNDLFPEVTVLLEGFRSPAINAALQRVNRHLVRHAALSVALGETMRRRLIETKGASFDRTIVIANWADTRAIVPESKPNAFTAAHALNGKFVVMHSGNLGLSQNLDTLIEAATILAGTPDIHFVLQGDGVRKAPLQQRVNDRGLTNVSFLPFQPRERLSASFAAADVFVVSLQRGMAGCIVPSKLYGILAAGRPYVAAVEDDCEVAALTIEHDCGVVIPPGDAEALAAAIQRLRADPDGLARMGANARHASQAFDRRGQIGKYAEAFGRVQAARSHGGREATKETADVRR
jgi:glycosyltransferase involved in cell wall biosynthesis